MKLVKWLAWVVGGLVVLIVLTVVGFTLFFPTEKARSMAIEKGTAALGRPVEIGSVAVSFWGGLGVKLEQVSVGNPAELAEQAHLFSAENIDVKLRLLPLLTGDIAIDRFIVNRPAISLYRRADGLTNFTFPTMEASLPPEAGQVPPEAGAAAAAVSFEKLEVNGGLVAYRDDSAGSSLRLIGLGLSTSMRNPAEGRYQLAGKIRVDTLSLEAPRPMPPMAVALAYEAEYDLPGKHLSIAKADVEVNDVRLGVTGEVRHAVDSLNSRLQIKSHDLSIAGLLSLLPPQNRALLAGYDLSGKAGIDGEIDYDQRRSDTLRYSLVVRLSEVAVAKEGINGKLLIDQASATVKPDLLQFTLEQGSFAGKPLRGSVVAEQFASPMLKGELGGAIDLALIKPFLPASGGHDLSGTCTFDLAFDGPVKEPRSLNVRGNLGIAGGRYGSAMLPEPIDSLTLDTYFDSKLVSVRAFRAVTKSSALSFAGRLENVVPWLMADSIVARGIDLGIDGNLEGKLELGLLNRYLPKARQGQIDGQAEFRLTLAGNTALPEQIRPQGELKISGMTYQDTLLPEPIRNLTADLRLSRDTIAVRELRVQFVSSDVGFTGSLARPFPYLLPIKSIDRSKLAKPFFTFALTARRFDTDKMFPEAVPGSETSDPSKFNDTLPAMILPDVDGAGTLAMDTVIYSRVEFTGIKGKVRIADRKVECYDITGDVYTGKVTGTTTVNLADFDNPRYTGDFTATQIEANDFISRFTKFGGFLYGKLDINGNYNAAGWEPEQFLSSLTLDGLGNIKQGKLMTTGSLFAPIQQLAEKAGRSIEKEQMLRELTSKIAVRDGRIHLDQLRTALGGLGDLAVSGSYGFDGTIQYAGDLLLSEEMTASVVKQGGLLGGLAGLLSNTPTQRLKVPIRISGTDSSPRLEIDMAAMQKGARDQVTDKASDALKGLFKKK